MESKALVRFEAVSLCQQPNPMNVGGDRVGIRSGTQPKSNGSDRGQLPQNRHTEAKMQGAYVPPASSGFLSLAN